MSKSLPKLFKPATLMLLALPVIYILTLQTIPNGSSHYYMIDVGEAQVVLNNWGTLHATGYPLYVMIGNALTEVMFTVGIDAVNAPAVVSLLWGMLALFVLYLLAAHLTGRIWLAAGMVLVYGLTRTVWIHHVIAEIYTFGLLILALLLAIALWQRPIKGRIYWLALIGGIGVAHHRAIAMAIPALLYAMLPYFRQHRKRLPRMFTLSLLIGLLGFTQYAYLYIRAQAGADWVYGDPSTLQGLWNEFIGKEAERFIGLPDTLDAFFANVWLVNNVLIRDVTLPGILLGVIGLVLAMWTPKHRRPAITLLLSGGFAYGFHVLLYSDVLSALILPMTLSIAFGWLFLVNDLIENTARRPFIRRYASAVAAIFTVLCATGLYNLNVDFIRQQTDDQTGLETIAHLKDAPDGSTVMLAWGPRYFAASVGKILLNELAHVTLVDDKVNLANVVERTRLITPEYTFFTQSPEWWEARLRKPVWLYAAAPRLVEIRTQPRITAGDVAELTASNEAVDCDAHRVVLNVTWQGSSTPPDENLSVYVHALDADGSIIGQGDQFAPVYGWRPVMTWLPNERVQDIYPIDVNPTQVASIRYGMYRILPAGTFENVSEYEVEVSCGAG